MSCLALPEERRREKDAADEAIRRARSVLPHILPAYENPASPPPPSRRRALIGRVSRILPPLSEWDNVELSVVLPLLAAVLGNGPARPADGAGRSDDDEAKEDGGDDDVAVLTEAAPSLAEFALGPHFDPAARSAAASCLFSTAARWQASTSSTEGCVALKTLREKVSPAAVKAAASGIDGGADDGPSSARTAFEDSINLAALLGSAAACRGGPSSTTGDEVAKFLARLACKGSAAAPGIEGAIVALPPLADADADAEDEGEGEGDGDDLDLDLDLDLGASLRVAAASALGSLLSVEGGGPFWRQRVAHIVTPAVLDGCRAAAAAGARYPSSSSPRAPPAGALVAACHIGCCAPVAALGERRAREVAEVAGRGLALCVELGERGRAPYFGTVSSVVLSTLIKFMAVAPDAVSNFAPALVPYLLKMCSLCTASSDVPLHLMTLQCLDGVTHLPGARKGCKAQKSAVMLHLSSAIDHPSHTVRLAAVQVKNEWCILE